MRKITIVLVTLAFVAGMAMAEDVVVSVSGTASVEWGFGGQLIDNTGSFLDAAVPSGDFFSDGGDLNWDKYPSLKLTASVEDADGNVIVEAASKSQKVDINMYPTPGNWDDEDKYVNLALDYIDFPNVVAGLLGIKLMGPDELEPAYQPAKSITSNERIMINVTPIPQLDATLGIIVKPDNKLYQTFYDDVVTPAAAVNGTFTWADDGNPPESPLGDADTFDDFGTDALDANGWEVGTYLSYALSLEATFTQELGEEDEISVGVGAVIDSAFTNGVYEPDYAVTGTKMYSVFTDAALMNTALTQAVITQMYGPIAVNPLSMKDENHAAYGGVAADDTMLRTNEVRGRATIPIGVGITADVAGLSASVDFQTRLTEGLDELNMTGITDLADATKSTLNYAAYAMPMYAAVDLAYELAAGDMTITPSVNFKYSSDFWKWDQNDDADGYEYDGDVSGADFVGRPMSVDVGLDVEGIAGMIDVALSAGLSLGDGVSGNHGLGNLPVPSVTYTHTNGVPDTIVYDNTVTQLIDFWLAQAAAADDATKYYNPLGNDYVPDTVSDGQNNGFFASGNSAMDIELEISADVMDGLNITNTTAYEIDNAGIGGADDLVLWGTQLSSLSNETEITYDWMVGDVVAFTIFGTFTYENVGYVTEMGQKYIGLRTDADPVGINDIFEFGYSEAPSMATFDYEVGVKVAVGL